MLMRQASFWQGLLQPVYFPQTQTGRLLLLLIR